MLNSLCLLQPMQHMPGTFTYASPELLLGQPCSEKADIYSFGVLLHALITHEQPVRGHLRCSSSAMPCNLWPKQPAAGVLTQFWLTHIAMYLGPLDHQPLLLAEMVIDCSLCQILYYDCADCMRAGNCRRLTTVLRSATAGI